MSNLTWSLDPTHSSLGFKIKHLMISNVSGSFNQFSVNVNGSDFETASVDISILVDSIHTNNADRDGHLKSADFFDMANFPAITFKSTSMTKVSEGQYLLKGNLSIKDQSQAIELKAELGGMSKDPWGNEKIAFEVTGVVNRKDFGLTYNAVLETGGVLIGEDIKVHAELQFVKQSAATA